MAGKIGISFSSTISKYSGIISLITPSELVSCTMKSCVIILKLLPSFVKTGPFSKIRVTCLFSELILLFKLKTGAAERVYSVVDSFGLIEFPEPSNISPETAWTITCSVPFVEPIILRFTNIASSPPDNAPPFMSDK